MVFSSSVFLMAFLPLTLLAYFIVPARLVKVRNAVLLASSLVFYGWGEPRYVFLVLATVLLAYIFGLLIERFRERSIAKLFLILSVVFLKIVCYTMDEHLRR